MIYITDKPVMDAAIPKDLITTLCRSQGFSGVGCIPIRPTTSYTHFRDWLAHEYHGTMMYLADHRATKRENAEILFPGFATLVCVTWPYTPSKIYPSPIAAYAYAQPDYHHVITTHLDQVLTQLKSHYPDLEGKVFADTYPILERDYAVQAGLGWIGKNTCIIDRARGSFFTLGGMALSLPVDGYDQAIPKNHCGSCTRCLDRCPTQAFVAPYVLDARKCISYLTIEFREVIPRRFFPALKGHFFGCDICQQVCPWNHKHLQLLIQSFDPLDWLSLSRTAFKARVQDTALSRLTFPMMQRNALIQLIHAKSFWFAKNQLEMLPDVTSLAWEQLEELVAAAVHPKSL